jgi:hypothetical protein
VLAAELLRYKRTIGDLELRICAAQRKQRHFDATLSTVHRAWHQLDDDLSTVAKHILPPVAAAGAGQTAVAAAAGEQNALYEALLTSTAHLSLVDITDSAALKLTGVALPQRTDADEPDPLVPSSDLSDGEAEDAAAAAAGGVAQLNSSSSSSSAAASEAVVGQVTAALAERLQFTKAVMGQVVAGMQRVFTTTTASTTAGVGAGAAAVLSLSGLQTELLAQKRTLTAEVLLMRDQLSLAHQRARELSREVRAARRERHRALRKLEQLAAVGVAIPEDNAPLANKPLVPGSSPGAAIAASAHRMSLSDGDAMDVSKLLSAVPALGSSSSAQQQQQQMSTPGSACQHTVPGGWSAAAAAAGGSSSSGRTAAAAAAADAEGALSAQEAEALRADLAALTEAADRRLAEADQLRRDKVELEQEVTRLTARSPAAAALAAVTGAAAAGAGAGAGADTAAAGAAAAEDAALQQQLLRHPEVLKLQLALDTAQKACASESARAAAAAARARELDTKLQQVNKAHETALDKMMQQCKVHCDLADEKVKEAVDAKSKTQDENRSAASEERTVKALTAKLETANAQLKSAAEAKAELEIAAKTAQDKATAAQEALQRERAAAAAAAAVPSASAAVAAGEAARLLAELATTRSELAGANRTVDMLATEVEATGVALTDVRNTNQRLMQTVADLEDSNLQLTQQIIQLKALLEQYAQEKVALDNRFAQAVGIEVSCVACAPQVCYSQEMSGVSTINTPAHNATQ